MHHCQNVLPYSRPVTGLQEGLRIQRQAVGRAYSERTCSVESVELRLGSYRPQTHPYLLSPHYGGHITLRWSRKRIN